MGNSIRMINKMNIIQIIEEYNGFTQHTPQEQEEPKEKEKEKAGTEKKAKKGQKETE